MNFSNLKEYLVMFSFPDISVLSDEDIEQVFAPENRQFLLKWIFQKMHREYSNALDHSDNVEETLMQLMQENGLGTSVQKTHFVKGDPSLSRNKQHNIFTKLFNRLAAVSAEKIVEKELTFDDCYYALDKILSDELILFPNNKLLTSKYMNKEFYGNESIDENELIYDDSDETLNMLDLNELRLKGEDLSINLHAVKSASKKLENLPTSNLSMIKESDTVILSCGKNVNQFLEYSKSVDVLSEDKKLTDVNLSLLNNNCGDMISELLSLSYKLKL